MAATSFGALLHRIVSPVVLAFMFYVVVTPIGMLKRAVSRGDAGPPNPLPAASAAAATGSGPPDC